MEWLKASLRHLEPAWQIPPHSIEKAPVSLGTVFHLAIVVVTLFDAREQARPFGCRHPLPRPWLQTWRFWSARFTEYRMIAKKQFDTMAMTTAPLRRTVTNGGSMGRSLCGSEVESTAR